MKKISLLLFCLLLLCGVNAQQKAVTDNGKTVILFGDGTWKYENDEDTVKSVIPINATEFKKDNTATFLLRSQKFNLGFWIDPKKWAFKKASSNADAEYELQMKSGDLYGMIITEKLEIPLETLKEIAIQNGKEVAPDILVTKEEYRIVNNLNVLMLQMSGTVKGIKFTYLGYYFSNEQGTLQFITYTSQSLAKAYFGECEKLLNGLVEIK